MMEFVNEIVQEHMISKKSQKMVKFYLYLQKFKLITQEVIFIMYFRVL